ncbi:uncharacterized protein [Anabrus simplex]|uniref:uncharacterized protein n=1 Tax=Anabrus simplex TaxID=316456 RepID=UPI0035A33AD7
MASWCKVCLPTIHSNDANGLIYGMPDPPPLGSDPKVMEELIACSGVDPPPDDDLQHLMDRSSQFGVQFPVQTVRSQNLEVGSQILEDNANSAYPLVHECVLYLMSDFLDFKQKYGSKTERDLYTDMGIVDFVHRLLNKRAVYFVSRWDCYGLICGKNGSGGWESVGKDYEIPPLVLRDCLSYDEMKLSALLSVSSRTVFVNDGNRTNSGVRRVHNVQPSGVIVGLIGPRLEKVNVMEYQEMIVSGDQNLVENGYGAECSDEECKKYNEINLWRYIWARFYGVLPNLPTYDEVKKFINEPNMCKRFLKLNDDAYFDSLIYEKRLAVSFETLLLEAEHRAKSARKKAFIHVVGIGLGVWSIDNRQEKRFLNAFASCLKKLKGVLPNVSDVRFGWFKETTCGGVGNGGLLEGQFRVHFSMDPPHTLLYGEHEGKLLVVSYAWDGNALPGNEFWCGDICSSGDPAAACSTQIAEIHNPHINPTKVSGKNLHVAVPEWGVMHISEYARRKMQSHPQCKTLLGLDCVKDLLFQIHSDDAYEPVGRCAPISGMPPVPRLNENNAVLKNLQVCMTIPKVPDVTLQEIIARSEAFPRRFGTETIRCRELLKLPGISEDKLQSNANSVYPILHECAIFLFVNFLEHKRKYGSSVERSFYTNMGLLELVHRLLEKRAVSFIGGVDCYQLANGEKGYGGWDLVGTDNEVAPLLLKNCLSYDEMKLSALLSVSSHTVFINDGRRKNRGIVAGPGERIEREGVVVGLIGPRLTRRGVNEFQEVFVTKDQNTKRNGYGSVPDETEDGGKYEWRKIWAQFYGVENNLPSYDEAIKNYRASKKRVYQRFTELNERELFDNMVYQKRIAVSAETLLLEAEHRAVTAGTTAYVHVVGIGLGVWRGADHQEKEFLDAFASCLKKLSERLHHVSDVRFGWFKEVTCGGVGDGGIIAGNIRLHFSPDPPHVQLKGKDTGKLLVVSYAWDSNALPGNEFWFGDLSTSGDPACACSTQVAELHNNHVNPGKVCGFNLHVASPRWGVLPIQEYAERMLEVSSPVHSPN